MLNKMILVVVFGLCPASSLGRGIDVFTGREEWFWTLFSVVYAEINCRWNTVTGVVATLQVKATLSGAYDAAERPSLRTRISYGPLRSAIPLPPPPKAHAVIVLFRAPDEAFPRPPQNPHSIPRDHFTFMPNSTALQVVQGFDDPAVSQIIANLREIRSKKPLSRDELARVSREFWAAKATQDPADTARQPDDWNTQAERLRKEYESLGRLDNGATPKKRAEAVTPGKPRPPGPAK